jgi:hypothetical protein
MFFRAFASASHDRGTMGQLRAVVTTLAFATALSSCDTADVDGSAQADVASPDGEQPASGPDDEPALNEADDDDAPLDASALPRFDAKSPFQLPDGGFIQEPARPSQPPPLRLTSLLVADRPPPPISGGSLTVTEDGTLAVAADPDRDALYVVKFALPNAPSVTKVSFAVGSEPGRTVLDGSGQAHVVLRSSGKVARVTLGSLADPQETTVCQHPRGLAYDKGRNAIWVACANGELVSLSARTHVELSRTFVALDLRDVIVTASGERFVSRYRSAELLRLDAAGKVVATSAPSATELPRTTGAMGTFSPTLAWRTITTALGLPLMLHQKSQEEEVIVVAGGYGGGCQTITQPGATQFDESGKPTHSATFLGAGLTVDVAVSADGQLLAMAAPAGYLGGRSGTLRVLPFAALAPIAPVSSAQPKAAPVSRDAGLPSSPTPARRTGGCDGAWSVAADVQTTAVAFDGKGLLYAFSREPAQLTVYTQQPDTVTASRAFAATTTVSLNERSIRDTGHELFHADVGSGLSCASCHGEALDDAHVWTFAGFGPRRTQNMRGGIANTLPLHWEGDLPTFRHLVDEVMTRRMGGFAVEPQYADALAAWIDTQPELKLASKNGAATERGRLLFESAELACATCHSGPELTNNQTVDVGTGSAFQVPSLRGLGLRAPFMHDGCASSLHQRFEPSCGGGDSHGKTSQLSEVQIADVVAYLETL